jgi:hypothetical protein
VHINISTADRIIRIAVAVFLVVLNLSGAVGFPESILVWLIAAIFIITAAVGNCPVYTLFGINTHTGKRTV